MADASVTFELTSPSFVPSRWDNHIERRPSVMRGQWRDAVACDRMLARGDPVLYEVYERRRPERAGELPRRVDRPSGEGRG